MRNAKEAGKRVEETQEIAGGLFNAQVKIPTQLIGFRAPDSVVKAVDAIVKEASEIHTIKYGESAVTRISGSITRSDVIRVLVLEMITKALFENAQWGITCPKNAFWDEFPDLEKREDNPKNNEMYRRMIEERYPTKDDAEQSLKEFITSSYGYENGCRRSDFAILAFNEEGDILPPSNYFLRDFTRDAILQVLGRDYDVHDNS